MCRTFREAYANALEAVRSDPGIMQQLRELAATGGTSLEDCARACAHVLVAYKAIEDRKGHYHGQGIGDDIEWVEP